MAASSLINWLRRSFPNRGPLRKMRRLGARAYRLAFPHPTHPFDRQHGVNTGGLIWADQLTSGHANDQHITAYWGSHPSHFATALDHWRTTLQPTPYAIYDYAFFDIGCGKGRVVLLASDSPFRSIRGVELNPKLAHTAQQNLALWNRTSHRCTDLAILNADALEVPITAAPALIYLFNPFDRPVLEHFLHRLQTLSLTRTTPIDILFTHLNDPALFDQVPGMTLLWRGRIAYSAEDAAADVFKAVDDSCHIYRLPGSASTSSIFPPKTSANSHVKPENTSSSSIQRD